MTKPGLPKQFIHKAVEYDGVDCLIWPYSVNDKGYGKLYWDGRLELATRIVLKLMTGEAGEGLQAAHLPEVCHTPRCVNPAHLYWATPSENQQDRGIDGTDNAGEKNPAAKLTEDQVAAIKDDSRVQRIIAEEYGVSQSMISYIKLNKKWKEAG